MWRNRRTVWLAIPKQGRVLRHSVPHFIPRAHRIWTLSFGRGLGSDLRADRESSLGFDTAGPEAQAYRLINSRKAKGRWY